MDIGAMVGGGAALVVGVLSWTQSRATTQWRQLVEVELVMANRQLAA
ncbi:hypothetical protein [Streptomyces turgidiscabies]|uniref:Uncharacterized protein n=1 Tax=Streptomyces turgidiscabies TaxID=85558 RepID=A0ABU0RRZ1_9ACTN|nr:hypothetical protein [Streptomyces turgidiscabies]MDQ0934765.1 hypothetical protein [Streptomyces turgidiscabies]